MSDQEQVLRQFCDVTGAPEDQSRVYLESSNWQLEVALMSFFDNASHADSSPPAPPAPFSVSSDESRSPPPARKKERRSEQRFATLQTLQQSSSSDEEEGQAFYAGGSERSGQQILGPNRGGDLVSNIFKSVRQRGAVAMEDDSGSSDGQAAAFSGTGYRLGQTDNDHTPVTSASQTRSQTGRSVRLQLYREGFTVDEGVLRPYSDPQNAAFINCIRRGEIPPELAADGEVRVSLEDRRHTTYKPSSGKPVFTGKGHVLGSPTPPTVGAPASVTEDIGDREANERAARASIQLDESKPVTSIQIRLADGTRLVERFNHTHRIEDLRNYITIARPEYQRRAFVLLTAFPRTELTDLTATLADSKLLSALVVQQML